uniref:ORF37 protein n=1 Tax=Plutella xylostella granulovirus TaxID=98383 RepID=A0A7U3W5S5_9BBAC|nr:ORF37 protein [Plutella xylostella granulovirus]
MFWLGCVLVLLFIYLMYHPLHMAFYDVVDDAEERNRLLNDETFRRQLRDRRYAPLHTLPSVSVNVDGPATGCFSTPTLVTRNDVPSFDCSAVCGTEASAYFYVDEHRKVAVDGVLLGVGGYCTTNSVPRLCNSETSILLYGANQWTCIAEDPRYFAGEANMIQMAGRQHSELVNGEQLRKNVLWDNLLNVEVNPTANTLRRGWDDVMEDGKRRFEVRCDALDLKHNAMFVNPYNAIECLPNVCTDVNHAHPDVRPDFVTGFCECGDQNVTRVRHIQEEDRTTKCASIVNRVHRDANTADFRVDCLSLDSPVSSFSRDKLLCPPSIFNTNSDFAYTFTLRGVNNVSGNGIHEPTYRLWADTRSRIRWKT